MSDKFLVGWSTRASQRTAFTLVEMLVSMAVMLLLVAFIGQIITLTGQAISVNVSKLDAAAQARLFFDRLGTDLASRPRRTDLQMVLTKANGNDSFQFYSQVDGYSGARHVAAIGYRVLATGSGPLFQLERGATGTDWAASPSPSSNSLRFTPQTPPPPADMDYEVLADGIFRLECCYLLNTGARSNTASADLSNVTAVIVTVGILPSSDRKFVTTDQIQQLSTALPDSAEGNDATQDTLALWDAQMPKAAITVGMPLPATQNIRLFEHTFYVP